nr:MAG TPA: hypothetical protein [Caudoviricetes sp.]
MEFVVFCACIFRSLLVNSGTEKAENESTVKAESVNILSITPP